VLKRKAATFIRQQESGSKPFFMYISTKAPHGPATPAPRHQDLFPNVAAPRPPSFNEDDVSDKPSWLRSKPRLDSRQIASIDKLHRKRLQSMMAVDEMIGHLVRELETSGKLRNTYLVFTSDNGFHMGQHRLMPGKRKPYEEDIRVPLIIRGPGVPAGRTLEHMVLNNDFARTFARLARVTAPEFVDGRSLMPLLSTNPPATSDWRLAFLVENWKGDSSYKAVRTRNSSYVEYENGERELYDLSQDPNQLHNKINTADPALLKRLSAKLAKLRGCEGVSCRAAENTLP
jgi:N-acetylglucosamine-6-sulfatase